MKSILMLMVGLLLVSCCESDRYLLVSKYGPIARDIRSLEDCEKLIKVLEIDGVCIKE